MVDSDRESSSSIADRSYVEINLRASSIKRVYKREVVDVLTYLGDLGGLLDVLLVVGQMLTSIVASKLFTAALIGQLYRIQEYMRDFTQYYQTQQNLKLTSESDSSESFIEEEPSTEKKLGAMGNNSTTCNTKTLNKSLPPFSSNYSLPTTLNYKRLNSPPSLPNSANRSPATTISDSKKPVLRKQETIETNKSRKSRARRRRSVQPNAPTGLAQLKDFL